MHERQAEPRRFHRDVEYYEAHQEELREQFPEEWVAIFNEQVVGAGPDCEKLLDQLEAGQVPLGKVFVH